jgi:hypothetical protein
MQKLAAVPPAWRGLFAPTAHGVAGSALGGRFGRSG